MRERCIGYGEMENKCTAKPLAKGRLWCARCERVRRARIDSQMKEITATFEREGRPL